ncbi:hypothetical protein BD560DRAFT_353026, partial [Blakeslea trispora]
MANQERSRLVRWRLGWLPHGCPCSCLLHPDQSFTRARAIHCLQMHNRLQMPLLIEDLLFFLLNIFSIKKAHSPLKLSFWTICWPATCHMLHNMDCLAHSTVLY